MWSLPAMDDGIALVQHRLGGQALAHGSMERLGRFHVLLRGSALVNVASREAARLLADSRLQRYSGSSELPRHPGESAGNSTSVAEGDSGIRAVGELVRFGTSASANWSREECKDFPKTCAPPFTCKKLENAVHKPRRAEDRLTTVDGHANVYSWCGYPDGYVRYAQQCTAGNMFHAAQELRNVQEERRRPDGSYPLLIMDAAYCFASGHCNDTGVTLHTTIPQAEVMCDAKYTRRGWTSINRLALAASPKRRGTDSAWAKVACAMGTYHCDIVYCRIYYCKDAEWRTRFGYLAEDATDHSMALDGATK